MDLYRILSNEAEKKERLRQVRWVKCRWDLKKKSIFQKMLKHWGKKRERENSLVTHCVFRKSFCWKNKTIYYEQFITLGGDVPMSQETVPSQRFRNGVHNRGQHEQHHMLVYKIMTWPISRGTESDIQYSACIYHMVSCLLFCLIIFCADNSISFKTLF